LGQPQEVFPSSKAGAPVERSYEQEFALPTTQKIRASRTRKSAAAKLSRAAADPEPAAESGGIAAAAEAVIRDKSLGERIKYLRLRKSMGLVELGRHTGLSASFLSQLETGRVVPTLRNLARIAMVFSRDISFFFEPERETLFRIIRAGERTRMPQSGADVPTYFYEVLGGVPNGNQVVPYVTEFLAVEGKSEQKEHPGAEFLYVLTGCLQITHAERVEDLGARDAVYFHSTTPHSYRRIGDEACTAMILTMPEPLPAKARVVRRNQ
jgi:transcriptional regulator with XRE-family HTH domain